MAVYDSHTTGTEATASSSGDTTWVAQTFTTTGAYTLSSVDLHLYRTGTLGTITVALKALDGDRKPTGSSLATGTIDGTTVTTDAGADWYTATFAASYNVADATEYALVISAVSTDPSYLKGRGTQVATYAGGWRIYSTNSGSTWLAGNTDNDLWFRTNGNAITSPPTSDAYVTKKLVAIGSTELWYESTPGTMSQLAASIGDLTTTDFLTAVEAYGKIFIANGTKLKVADFINIKITTTDVVPGGAGVAPPDFGTLLTGGTSGATMIVDYITALDGSCTIYGKKTSTASFAAETVTGTDDDGNGISFTGTAEVAGPHWYNWTVWGGSSTYGVMPTKANLVCKYRGRLVLSGNSQYPHQWYMSKVGNPWNWVYASTDPLTAVAGNNTDAGRIGDTVQALIPYGDDFLVFGCSGSVYLLDGDPAFGGSIDELADYTGIYGARSWCKDAQYNLYFFGSSGVYKMTGGRSLPVNISELHLPNLYSDWSPNQATKRIVLSYDPDENGVIITITTLADGTNLSYFYSLKTEGFYPESYPTACGIFSSYYYEPTNSTYKGLLLGSNDGYIRKYLKTAKDDDSGGSDTTISSYVLWPLLAVSEDPSKYGLVKILTIELAGGAASGTFSDSDAVTYSLYKGNSAETILEDIYDGATAFTSGILTGTGRSNNIRPRMRTAFLGLKFSNSTASQTFAINKVTVDVKPVGNI